MQADILTSQGTLAREAVTIQEQLQGTILTPPDSQVALAVYVPVVPNGAFSAHFDGLEGVNLVPGLMAMDPNLTIGSFQIIDSSKSPPSLIQPGFRCERINSNKKRP